MNIFKRLKNLYNLSELQVKDNTLTMGEVEIPIRKHQQAKVIKREDPIEDFLKTI